MRNMFEPTNIRPFPLTLMSNILILFWLLPDNKHHWGIKYHWMIWNSISINRFLYKGLNSKPLKFPVETETVLSWLRLWVMTFKNISLRQSGASCRNIVSELMTIQKKCIPTTPVLVLSLYPTPASFLEIRIQQFLACYRKMQWVAKIRV